MTNTDRIALFDAVELTDAVETAPAGAQGGVVELLDDHTAIVEVTTMPSEPPLERIVVAPLSRLRRIGHVRAKPHGIAA